jgi:hypothetical protein
MFLDLPNQGAQGRTWILGPYPRQSRYRRALFRKRRRYPTQKESIATRRRSIPIHAHAQDVPETKNDVLSSGRLQDPGPGTIPNSTIPATTMDQFDCSQSVRAGPRPRSMWYILLLHAVCRLYGSRRYLGSTRRHLVHHLHHHRHDPTRQRH